MEGFTYTDIFETKGIEYIIIITFLVLLVPFWFFVNRKSATVQRIRQAIGVLSANLLKIPQGLFYNRNHTWAFLEQSGTARVGLDDFLLKVTGDVTINQLTEPGSIIRKGDLLATLEREGKSLRVFSPISGEVLDANMLLSESPDILQEDPYGKGWLYSIKPSHWKEETSSCYLAGEASEWIKGELDRLKDFLAVSLGKHSPGPAVVAFQEGGELRINPLAEMEKEIWDDFQEEFLDE